MRLLRRSCQSDEHILSECPTKSPIKRIHFVKTVFVSDNVTWGRDNCYNAVDEIQKFDGQRCECVCSAVMTTTGVNGVNFVFGHDDIGYERTVRELTDRVYAHKMTKKPPNVYFNGILDSVQNYIVKFEGIFIGDGAQKCCAGLEAYKRYCVRTNTPVGIIPSRKRFHPLEMSAEFLEIQQLPRGPVSAPSLIGWEAVRKNFRSHYSLIWGKTCRYHAVHSIATLPTARTYQNRCSVTQVRKVSHQKRDCTEYKPMGGAKVLQPTLWQGDVMPNSFAGAQKMELIVMLADK